MRLIIRYFIKRNKTAFNKILCIFAIQLHLIIYKIVKNRAFNLSIDFFGITASLLCAIHCAFLPFILTAASLTGLQFLANPWIEYSVIALSLLLVVLSLLPAYKNHHHRLTPIFIVVLGFVFIIIGQFSAEEFEIVFTCTGAVLVAIAHGFNWFLFPHIIKKRKVVSKSRYSKSISIYFLIFKYSMIDVKKYEVVIIGGSYAGLAAALSLSRAMRKVLVIDSQSPCNQSTPFSHNFLTHDGSKPSAIIAKAKSQINLYSSTEMVNDETIAISKTHAGFLVDTYQGRQVLTKKILFCTGLEDFMPKIPSFKECWGNSILHCPYCHGYEFKNEPTGILGNGDVAFEMAKLISNWTKQLTIFTNEAANFKEEQLYWFKQMEITLVQKEIQKFSEVQGQIGKVILQNQEEHLINALYARPVFQQKSILPEQLGCQLNQAGLIEINEWQQTTINHIYAAGDNSNPLRSIAMANASGSVAGAFINKDLVEEEFNMNFILQS